jgi:hypothetical protein
VIDKAKLLNLKLFPYPFIDKEVEEIVRNINNTFLGDTALPAIMQYSFFPCPSQEHSLYSY